LFDILRFLSSPSHLLVNDDYQTVSSAPTDTTVDAIPPPRPRVFVRVIIGIVLVIGMAAGYVAMGRQKAAKQAEAIEAVVQAGGRVYLDYQWHNDQPVPDAQPPQAMWLRRLVGDAMLNHAVAVDLRGVKQPDAVAQSLLLLPYLRHINAAGSSVSDASLAIWRRMPGLTQLDLHGTRITDAGVEYLSHLRQLKRVDLTDTSVSNDAVKRLRAALPKCEVNADDE
jgi:hypothetical protein